jgi:hypothetical protein
MLKYKKKVAKVLLVCMTLQPLVMFADIDTQKKELISMSEIKGKRISAGLASPLKSELALFSQFSTSPLLNDDKTVFFKGMMPQSFNQKILSILKNKMVITHDDLTSEKYFSSDEFALKKTRIKLFGDLQFSNADGKNSIIKTLGNTITRAGRASFLNLVSQEHSDWSVTKKRQAFIKSLVENPKLLEKVQEDLLMIAKTEEILAKQVTLEANPLEAMSQMNKIMMFIGLQIAIFYLCYLKNPVGYTALKYTAYADLYFGFMYLIGKIAQTETFGSLGAILMNTMYAGMMGGASAVGLACLTSETVGLRILQCLNAAKVDYTILDRVMLPSLCAALVFGIYKFVSFMNSTNKTQFDDAKGIAQLLRATDRLQKKLQESGSDSLSFAYGKDFENQLSGDWKELVEKAQSTAFNPDKEHHFFSAAQPKVLNFMTLLDKTIGDLSNVLQFYGEIDAYASMAQLYLDAQDGLSQGGDSVHCCFVELLEDSESAVFNAKNMWHPIFPQSTVRTNSIALGGFGEVARNAIITGPNAAGKSATMKAMLVNVILGQTFGVACAEELSFTPYKKIIARFTSADDTANNESKYMLEAKDVVATLKELDSLQAGERALVITDELFSGTEMKPAILLSTELCMQVAPMKNVNYVLATHYKDLTQLKELTGGSFENFKVTAFVDEDSHVSYPFKLMHGIGDVNVAFDIFLDQMRKQGLSNELLEAMIKNARNRNMKTKD